MSATLQARIANAAALLKAANPAARVIVEIGVGGVSWTVRVADAPRTARPEHAAGGVTNA